MLVRPNPRGPSPRGIAVLRPAAGPAVDPRASRASTARPPADAPEAASRRDPAEGRRGVLATGETRRASPDRTGSRVTRRSRLRGSGRLEDLAARLAVPGNPDSSRRPARWHHRPRATVRPRPARSGASRGSARTPSRFRPAGSAGSRGAIEDTRRPRRRSETAVPPGSGVSTRGEAATREDPIFHRRLLSGRVRGPPGSPEARRLVGGGSAWLRASIGGRWPRYRAGSASWRGAAADEIPRGGRHVELQERSGTLRPRPAGAGASCFSTETESDPTGFSGDGPRPVSPGGIGSRMEPLLVGADRRLGMVLESSGGSLSHRARDGTSGSRGVRASLQGKALHGERSVDGSGSRRTWTSSGGNLSGPEAAGILPGKGHGARWRPDDRRRGRLRDHRIELAASAGTRSSTGPRGACRRQLEGELTPRLDPGETTLGDCLPRPVTLSARARAAGLLLDRRAARPAEEASGDGGAHRPARRRHGPRRDTRAVVRGSGDHGAVNGKIDAMAGEGRQLRGR